MNYRLRSFILIILSATAFNSFAQPWQKVGDSLTLISEKAFALNNFNIPYVVGGEWNNYHAYAIVKKLEGNHWLTLPADTTKNTLGYQIVIGPDNLPVISYTDSSTFRVIVEKFDGTKWNKLSSPPVGIGYRLAVDKKNNLYIAADVVENGFGSYLTVYKYEGNQWNYVGNPQFTRIYSSDFSLAINTVTNQPYVLYNDDYNYQISVQKFNGTSWEFVGQQNICTSVNGAYYLNIDFDGFGHPVIGFQDDNGPEQISVYNLRDNVWKTVGKQYFSPTHCYDVILKVSYDGTPFVCFSNGASYSASVMKYANKKWQFAGDTAFASPPYVGSFNLGKGAVPYFLSAPTRNTAVLLRNTQVPAIPLRISTGLFTQAGCQPWLQDSSQWVTFKETKNDSTFLSFQAYFQNNPGNLCNYLSYAYEATDLRDRYGWNGGAKQEYTGYGRRNFKIKFSGSPFTNPGGIRLFFTAKEINDFVKSFNQKYGTAYTPQDIFIEQYDGANQDNLISNNSNKRSDYTKIYPQLYYYGTGNKYCYMEFFTSHCSEFYIALSSASGAVQLISKEAKITSHLSNNISGGDAIIYPNPASNVVHITGKDLQLIQVYNLAGKVLMTIKPTANSTAINVSHFAKGIYIVYITNVLGKIEQRKLVVQ